MQTFLGVPVLLRGTVYGNLYLTEKEDDADFTEEDEEVAITLAAQAAVAIENARLYESVTRWMRQLESMEEIGQALVSDLDLPSDARADLPSSPRARSAPGPCSSPFPRPTASFGSRPPTTTTISPTPWASPFPSSGR